MLHYFYIKWKLAFIHFLLLCKHCSSHLVWIIYFNLDKNPVRWVLFLFHFICGILRFRKAKSLDPKSIAID